MISASKIATGYVLGRFYIFGFKLMTLMFTPLWIITFCIAFSFTYNPTEKELNNYPPILSSSTIQDTASHVRYNFRVVLATVFPIPNTYFKDLNNFQRKNFPKQEDALIKHSRWNGVLKRISVQVPMVQKISEKLYRLTVDSFFAWVKNKPVSTINWNMNKKE